MKQILYQEDVLYTGNLMERVSTVHPMYRPIAGLLVAWLLVTAGCSGVLGEQREPSDTRAQDALNRSRATLEDVNSYRVTHDGTARMVGDDREVSAALNGDIAVNVTSREMNSTAQVEDPTTPMPGVRRTYVNGYTALTECRLAGWGRRNLSESRDWFDHTPIGEQFAVLSRTPVYWVGTDRLNGTEAAVIVAHPTKKELLAGAGVWTLEPREPAQANFRNATLRLWISTETWRPLRIHRESNWRVGGASVTLSATWRIGAYDKSTNVTRPSIPESRIREDGC